MKQKVDGPREGHLRSYDGWVIESCGRKRPHHSHPWALEADTPLFGRVSVDRFCEGTA